MLGKFPLPGRPTNLDYSRARAYCACGRCGWGCLDIFSLIYHFSFLSPSLWETARYRLKYCLKGPLSPKQPIVPLRVDPILDEMFHPRNKRFFVKVAKKEACPYTLNLVNFDKSNYPVFYHRMLLPYSTHIGEGRFRILGGGQGLEYWWGQGGPNSQQAHDVVMTSMRRNNVASTSFRRHVPTRFLINQCQIITFLILKSDIIENSRIELRAIVLPVPSNRIKVAFIIILPLNLVHL